MKSLALSTSPALRLSSAVARRLAAAAALLTVSASAVAAQGTAEVSLSAANVSGEYPASRIHSASFLLNEPGGHKWGLGITYLDAWGQHTRLATARWVAPLNGDKLWLDTQVAVSDKGSNTVRSRVSTSLNFKPAGTRMIVGAGLDTYDMRGGGSSTGLKMHAVHYSASMPLVTQADVAVMQSDMNDRNSHRAGVAVTYGKQGEWTTAVRADYGNVHYELERFPGTVARYDSWHTSVTGRRWIEKDWGVLAGLSHVNNRYYTRNEARVGAFWSF